MKKKNRSLAPGPEWLKSAVFYQIYPQSFLDTNDDGIGDLQGIIEKLDYIASLGVNALWLNPIYDSPFLDAGYDVVDFRMVAPRYGTNADAKRLFREARKRGIRVVLDLVAGHTSINHPWFLASCLNFWFRTGVSIREGSREWTLDKPGTFHDLDGGQPVEIRSGDSLITILGLPPCQHKAHFGAAGGIPGALQSHCAALSLGLRFPVDLNLTIRLG
jgi:hypothetical protein